MVSLQKDIIQLRSCQCRIHRRKNQFRTVIIKNTIYILFRICQTDISALRKPLSCLFQHFCKFTEHFMTFCCHRIHTCIDTCHKNIGRAARLIDSHKSPNKSSIHSVTAVMKNCSLRHSRKRFVKALDYKVCSKFHCWSRKIIREMKMCSMCLINNQRNLIFVRNLCNWLNIRDHSVVSRWSDQYCFDLGILCKTSFHFVRKNSAVYPPLHIHLWINISWF